MKRGEIYWADLAPRSGSEQQGNRPVIVISHDAFNEVPSWRSVIVVPVSTSASQARRGPTAVLLERGADVNSKSEYGTALAQAAEVGDVATVKVLLEFGADIRARDPKGRTAVMRAAQKGHTEVVRLLRGRATGRKR